MPLSTLDKAPARVNNTMRLGDIWAGPTGARWRVTHVALGRAYLVRHEARSTKGARRMDRPVLAPPAWELIKRGD
jgi:hypothetical protein